MKKLLLSVVAVLGIYSLGFGQLALKDTAGVTLTNGDTVVTTGLVGTQLSDRFFIYDSALAINIKVLCTPTKDSTSGCTYSICVGSNCYAAVPMSSTFNTTSFKVPSGKDTNALYTDYNAINAGISIVKYEIRNNTMTDSAWIYVKFIASPASIPTITANNLRVSSLYPNPANGAVNLSYHSDYDANLGIYNSIGQLVKSMPLASSRENVSINTADMPSGIYICKVQAAGAEPAFRRLVVSH
jgi:hypothetical protein